MKKFVKASCLECGEATHCYVIGGDPICAECLDDWGDPSALQYFTALSDEGYFDGPSDADPGL